MARISCQQLDAVAVGQQHVEDDERETVLGERSAAPRPSVAQATRRQVRCFQQSRSDSCGRSGCRRRREPRGSCTLLSCAPRRDGARQRGQAAGRSRRGGRTSRPRRAAPPRAACRRRPRSPRPARWSGRRPRGSLEQAVRAVLAHAGQQAGGGGGAVFAAPPTRTAHRPKAGRNAARGSRVRCRRPSRTTRWRPAGATTTRPAAAATGSPSSAKHTRRAGLAVEPIREGRAERLVDMQDEQDRQLECPAAGCAGSRRARPGRRSSADRDDRVAELAQGRLRDRPSRNPVPSPVSAGRITAAVRRGERSGGTGRARARQSLRTEVARGWMGDHRIAATSFTVARSGCSQAPSASVTGRLFQHIDRAGRERVVDLEQLAAIDRGRHDQDRRRTMRHDVFGGGKAAHHRQHHVHGDHVGPVLPAQLDGALAVLGLADHLDVRIGRRISTRRLRTVSGIFDDQDAGLRHRLSHQRRDHGEQLGLIELALDDVALRADVAPALAVFRRGPRGDQDRRNVAARPGRRGCARRR